jgi:hypothetical protein
VGCGSSVLSRSSFCAVSSALSLRHGCPLKGKGELSARYAWCRQVQIGRVEGLGSVHVHGRHAAVEATDDPVHDCGGHLVQDKREWLVVPRGQARVQRDEPRSVHRIGDLDSQGQGNGVVQLRDEAVSGSPV